MSAVKNSSEQVVKGDRFDPCGGSPVSPSSSVTCFAEGEEESPRIVHSESMYHGEHSQIEKSAQVQAQLLQGHL